MLRQNVQWATCEGGQWCRFYDLNLISVDPADEGVYVIWLAPTPDMEGKTVYVGQGNIRARLSDHRNDERIAQHSIAGMLLVTWAVVPLDFDKDGIEAYLAKELNPAVGVGWPRVVSIPVNLPWSRYE